MKKVIEIEKLLAAFLCGWVAMLVLVTAGCTKDQAKHDLDTVISDIKAVDAALTKVAPIVTAVAEVLAPKSTAAIDMAKATVVLQNSNNAIQSLTITLPPPATGNTAQKVVGNVQGGSQMAAQLAPQLANIVEAFAPGSTASKDMSQAAVKITTVNNILQAVTITPPSAPPDAAPATAAQPVPPAPASPSTGN